MNRKANQTGPLQLIARNFANTSWKSYSKCIDVWYSSRYRIHRSLRSAKKIEQDRRNKGCLMVIATRPRRVAVRQDVCVGSRLKWSLVVSAHTVGFSSPAALRSTICSLLYRLLIICAHLQRHSAIGYLLPLADLMLSAPLVPAPFDREARRLFSSRSLALLKLFTHNPFLFFLFGIIPCAYIFLPRSITILSGQESPSSQNLFTTKAHKYARRSSNPLTRTREERPQSERR